MKRGGSLFFLVSFLITVMFLEDGCSHKKSDNSKAIGELIAKADSIKNSNPDLALDIYNQAISAVLSSDATSDDSILLAETHIGASAAYLMKGDIGKAIQHDSIAEVIALKYAEPGILSKVYLAKGTIRFKTGDYKTAIVFYNKSLSNASILKDSVTIAKISSNEAMILFNSGEVEKAIDGFSRALRIGQRIKNEELIANNYLNLAIVYTNQSKNDSVESYISKALSHFKRNNDKAGELSCYRSLGSFYYNKSDYSNAIKNFRLSLNVAIEIGEKPSIAKGYHNLSELYFRIGDMERAISLLDKSIKLKVELGDSLSLAKGYTATGNIHYSRDSYNEALDYYRKALKIYEKKKIIDELGSAYSNIGNAYSGLHKSDSAMYYYEKSIKYHLAVDYQLGVSNSYINLGDEYRVNNDLKKSEVYFLKALSLKKQLQDEEGILTVYKYLANLYFDQSKLLAGEKGLAKLKEAEIAGKRSYNMAKNLGLKPEIQDGCHVLMNIYKSFGQFQEALCYSNEYNELSRSILDKNKIEALTFAEARWNVAKEQQEIENLKNVQRYNAEIIKQSKVEARQHKLIIWALVALSLFIGVSVLVIAMYLKKRRDALYQKQLARITALRLQNTRNSMSPHFFFNVLGSVTGLTSQPERLKEKLKSLTFLLRKVIENIDQIAIPLENELEAVKTYIDLYSERIPQPFEVEYAIGEGTRLDRLVPAMIIQIPVENAIKHGLMPMEGEKRLTVSIAEFRGCQQITVSDNGIGLKASTGRSAGTGTGLKVLLQTIYFLNTKNQQKIKFTISEKEPEGSVLQGTVVQIEIPLIFDYSI
jgi:tetratricopeptide (TPR) repeat protein